MSNRNITRLLCVVNKSLFRIDGTLDYNRVTDAIISLANTVQESETDENTWYIGESSDCDLASLVIGAYWHYTEWHGGQSSKGYAALCALGQIFEPNMSTLDNDAPEHYAYSALDNMASG